MSGSKANNSLSSSLFPRLERRGEPLLPHWLFYRRLAVNVGIALMVVVLSLLVGMVGYHALEGLSWVRSFGHAAMILGGMGPYSEPVNDSSKLFEGIYAIYCGLLLIGVTGLILAPVFHRVMHQLHLPDETDAAAPKPKPKKPGAGAKR